MLYTHKHGHDLGVVYGIRFTKYQAERAKAEEEAAAAAAAEAQVEFSYYITYMFAYIRNIYIYGYGSIPINTIFSGMNIHLPAILMFTWGTRF